MTTRTEHEVTRDELNAIEMLIDDHERVQKLFSEYEEVREDGDSQQKIELARKICVELTIHAQLEEEIFYPAVRAAIEHADVMDEAEVEHDIAKDLIADIESSSPDEDVLYDAKVSVLGEYVRHHVEEEEDEMFAQLKEAKLDTAGLGAEMAERRMELKSELGLEVEDEEEAAAAE